MMDSKLVNNFIKTALAEDVGDGDHTSLACIPKSNRNKAKLLVKDTCVLAGIDLAKDIFQYVDPTSKIELLMKDGDDAKFGDIAFYVDCNSQALLKAERLVLNTMQRMSGIATLSRKFADKVKDLPVKILDTRKTTPLIRFIEKEAVKLGGCYNYRIGLYDWIMIKDNHIDAAGSITNAIQRVLKYQKDNKMNLNITVEVRNIKELKEVLENGQITRIMLDNFSNRNLKKAVGIIDGRFETEASGGVNLRRVRGIAETGVDFISVGALTHSVASKDLSLKIVE